MKNTRNFITIPLAFLCFQNVLLSQDEVQERAFSLITDQDFFYSVDPKRNEDRNYTQGSVFAISNDHFYHSFLFYPIRLIGKIHHNDSVVTERTRQPIMSTIGIVGTAFTPRIIDSINPIIGDRPFSFLFAISTSQINRVGNRLGHKSVYEAFTLNYGLLGTRLGYNFQSFAHTHIIKGRPKDPRGWNTQISEGGRPTFLFEYQKMKCYAKIKKSNRQSAWGIDGFMNLGGSVGYYDRIYTGAYARFGWIDSSNQPAWAFWGNSLSTANKGTLGGGQPIPTKHFELFGFGRATVNLMTRNSLLLGQRFQNNTAEYTLDPSWINVAVLDVDFGIGYGFYWIKDPETFAKNRFIRILYKNTMRSPEFDSGIFPKRWHYYGSCGIQFSI